MPNVDVSNTLVTCQMCGGPQDRARHVFDYLPLMLIDGRDGGFYQWTTKRGRDGAYLFEYHA